MNGNQDSLLSLMIHADVLPLHYLTIIKYATRMSLAVIDKYVVHGP